jgi:hypothetical protein
MNKMLKEILAIFGPEIAAVVIKVGHDLVDKVGGMIAGHSVDAASSHADADKPASE